MRIEHHVFERSRFCENVLNVICTAAKAAEMRKKMKSQVEKNEREEITQHSMFDDNSSVFIVLLDTCNQLKV